MHELDEWLPVHEAAKTVGRSVRSLQRWNTYDLVPKRRVNGRLELLRSGLFAARDMLQEMNEATQIHNTGKGRAGPGRGRGPKRVALDALLEAGVSPEEAQAEVRCSDSMVTTALRHRAWQQSLWSGEQQQWWEKAERELEARAAERAAVREARNARRRAARRRAARRRAMEKARVQRKTTRVKSEAARDAAARRAACEARKAELFAHFDNGLRYAYLRDNGLTDLSQDYVQELLQEWHAERQAAGAVPMKIKEHSAAIRNERRRQQLWPYFEQGHSYAYLRDNGLTDLSKSTVNSLFQKWRNEQRETGNNNHGTTKD